MKGEKDQEGEVVEPDNEDDDKMDESEKEEVKETAFMAPQR